MTAQEPVWTIQKVLQWATQDFHTRGISSPRLDAEVLLSHSLQLSRIQLVLQASRPLAPHELTSFRRLVLRRRTFEPVAYLCGQREFYGRMFQVDKRVLIPRPETELLVETALNRTQSCALSLRALELGTGSGCIAVTLAKERPTSQVHALDCSPDALAVARGNALRLGAYNASFALGDLFTDLSCQNPFDLVISNPPYIPTAEVPTLMLDVTQFEPHLALDGGADGLDLVRRIVDQAAVFLASEGVLALEIGAGQAPEVATLLRTHRYRDVWITRDYGKIERIVSGIRPL